MMWIRSQNRTKLIKVKAINVVNHQVFGYLNETEEPQYNGFLIGEYQSEERALEVLDDIQDFIEKQIDFERSCQFANAKYPEISSDVIMTKFVYEMPEK
ncbi:MAG: hypothetical protein H0Z24_06950 [Thermosipho sp. (in: Bacteria)]|nr:hypothetical protein [Thermosipho sp. (in: thermotogales)]